MRYHKLSRFPAIKQDMTLQVPSSIPFVEVSDFITSELSKSIGEDGYIFSELLSIFKPKDKDGLNYAFRITITDYNKTLKDVEVNQLLDDVATKASEKLKAIRI
jgi:phenylalanyl-tRNA synthetase beta subunit